MSSNILIPSSVPSEIKPGEPVRDHDLTGPYITEVFSANYLLDVIRRQCRRSNWHLDADALEDCSQEIALLLWRIRKKISALPETARIAYAAACVHHVISWYLCQERQYHAHICLAGKLFDVDRETNLGISDPSEEMALFADDLKHQISCPYLCQAFLRLSAREETLLTLYYVQEKTDVEIAALLEVSASAAKMQRRRTLAKLRAALPEVYQPSTPVQEHQKRE